MRLDRIATRYLAFAGRNPAVYDAMFSMPIGFRFGTPDAPSVLHRAFAAIQAAVGPDGDSETRAELFWSALHGLAELERHHRLRPSHHRARLGLLVDGVAGSPRPA